MATEDLTPKVVQSFDDTELVPGGGARQITRVRFMVGRFGPYDRVFDRTHTQADITAAMQAQREKLTGLV